MSDARSLAASIKGGKKNQWDKSLENKEWISETIILSDEDDWDDSIALARFVLQTEISFLLSIWK